MEDLHGKVAVVTGAASGIGLALAHRFAAEAMAVVLADIEEPALDRAMGGFSDGANVMAVVTDVSDPEQVDALRDSAVEAFGTVHVVCNNAGVAGGGPVWETSLEDWRWVMGVNLWGVIHGIRSFVPLMRAQGEGHVVNTASMAGVTSPPYMGVYNVTKHGVVTLSETLFAELAIEGSAVGVSVLCPGWVNTGIGDSQRNRPADLPGAMAPEGLPEGGPAMRQILQGFLASGLDPAEVADQVLDAIRAKRFYLLTHPEWSSTITARVERIVSGENPNLAFLPVD